MTVSRPSIDDFPRAIVCLNCGARLNQLSVTDAPICRPCDALMVRAMSDSDARVVAVIATLRYVAGLQFAKGDEAGATEYRGIVEDIQRSASWDCCPLCEEVTCDEGCALEPVRSADVNAPMFPLPKQDPDLREGLD